jgi:hypothetical protein
MFMYAKVEEGQPILELDVSSIYSDKHFFTRLQQIKSSRWGIYALRQVDIVKVRDLVLHSLTYAPSFQHVSY